MLAILNKEIQSVIRHINQRLSIYKKQSNNKGFANIYRECTRSIYCALRDECINNNDALKYRVIALESNMKLW